MKLGFKKDRNFYVLFVLIQAFAYDDINYFQFDIKHHFKKNIE